MYTVEVIIPTARLAFWVEDGVTNILPEHDPPACFRQYEELKQRHDVVGMTTFPNTILLRGPKTVLVDPGIELGNSPQLGALACRGLSPDDLDMIVLTHAHSDHCRALVDFPNGVTFHDAERRDPGFREVASLLEEHKIDLLYGEEGQLAEGIDWVRTPGHTDGSIALKVQTGDGLVVLCGDTIGPLPEDFAEMRAPSPPPSGDQLLKAWELIRSWHPALVVPGHMQPFSLE